MFQVPQSSIESNGLQGHYKIRKPPLPSMEGDVDLCEVVEDDSFPEVTAMLSAYGVSNKCPVPGPVCRPFVSALIIFRNVVFMSAEESVSEW